MVQHRRGATKKLPQTFKLNVSHPDKNPHKKEQQAILKVVDSIMPTGTKKITDKVTGIDYNYNGLTIDKKFGFGKHSDNTIIIRTENGKLINKSEVILVIHKNRLEFFNTAHLKEFVETHTRKVTKDSELRTKRRKGKVYQQAKIKLSDLYRLKKIKPFTVQVPLEQIAKKQTRIKRNEAGKLQNIMLRAIRRVEMSRVSRIVKNHKKRTGIPTAFAKKMIKQKEKPKRKTAPKAARIVIRR